MNDQIKQFIEILENAEAIVIGAGSGLSASAGLTYSGTRFEENFRDFIKKYGMTDMYSAGFYPFETLEEKWAYWSRHILVNRFEVGVTRVYQDLKKLLENKNYFVITTNVDHQFYLAGFPDEKVFATQGDYGLFQCARACHQKVYQNEVTVREMVNNQLNCRIPTALIPKCPVCGGEMDVNLRRDGYFVEASSWHQAADRYRSFIEKNINSRIVFLELGVGMNTPVIIKYPFMQMTAQLKQSCYLVINKGPARIPHEIAGRTVFLDGDIGEILQLLESKRGESK